MEPAKAGDGVPRTEKPRPGEAGASPIFPDGKGLTGSWSRTQEGGDALRLPEALTDTCAPGTARHTPEPSCLKGCSALG